MFGEEIFSVVGKVIDKIFPDKQQADEAKLKLLELQQAGELKQMEFETKKDELEVSDRNSARVREAQVHDMVPAILAYASITGFFGLLILLIFVDVDKEALQILNIMIGSLGTIVSMVFGYYFGTSVSSRRKDDVISTLSGQ
jgi:hypothetical protein